MLKPITDGDRYYQRAAKDAFWKYYSEGNTGNILISLATGTGKSRVAAGLCKETIEAYPETNIVVLVSSSELVGQNYAEMKRIWPDAPAGVYSAGLNKRNFHEKITFATIQSVFKKAFKWPRKIDFIICDECQDISEKDGTMYRKFINDLKLVNPNLKVIGLSATIFRLTQGLLTEGENGMFDDIVYEYGMLQGIKDGYLSPLISKAMGQKFDLSGVGTRNGDYIPGQLEKAVDKDPITKAIVDEIISYGAERKCWLAFCAGIDHAIHVRDEIRSRGFTCEAVSSKTPKTERDEIFRRYKAGEIRCLTNVNILSKGSNIPQIDLIASLRPSKSAGLVVQACGRGTRLSQEKVDCLILDFADWLLEHGPIDLIKPKSKKKKGEGAAPVKTCPKCSTIVFAGLRVCPVCSHEFPAPELDISTKANEAAVLSTQLKTEKKKVTNVLYYRHEKAGSKPSLRVEYMCGLMESYREWVALEHNGFAREKACKWWVERSGQRAPNTIEEAIARKGELKIPTEIEVRRNGKYFDIVGYEL